MLHHPRRPWRSVPSALLCAALLVPALAACGSDDTDDAASGESSSSTSSTDETAGETTGETIDGVEVTGDVGDSLAVEFTGDVTVPEEPEPVTLVEGGGDPVEEGDTVNAYLYLGDATSQTDLLNNYDQGTTQAIPVDAQAGDLLLGLMSGATYGSRVAAATTVDVLLDGAGEDNPLGVGVDDALVVIVDLVSEQESSPTPSSDQAEDADPSTQPTLVEEDGDPVGLDFSGLEEPALDTPVQRVVLEEGDGPAVTSSDTITVDYLGSTFDADEPFDGSYSRGEPLTSALSGLIQGWAIGLDGVPVGSRVLLQIPPAYGYGAEGSGAIPGNATLWFVIDVISAE